MLTGNFRTQSAQQQAAVAVSSLFRITPNVRHANRRALGACGALPAACGALPAAVLKYKMLSVWLEYYVIRHHLRSGTLEPARGSPEWRAADRAVPRLSSKPQRYTPEVFRFSDHWRH